MDCERRGRRTLSRRDEGTAAGCAETRESEGVRILRRPHPIRPDYENCEWGGCESGNEAQPTGGGCAALARSGLLTVEITALPRLLQLRCGSLPRWENRNESEGTPV